MVAFIRGRDERESGIGERERESRGESKLFISFKSIFC